jgi:hypothetical protein
MIAMVLKRSQYLAIILWHYKQLPNNTLVDIQQLFLHKWSKKSWSQRNGGVTLANMGQWDKALPPVGGKERGAVLFYVKIHP